MVRHSEKHLIIIGLHMLEDICLFIILIDVENVHVAWALIMLNKNIKNIYGKCGKLLKC